MDTRRYQQRQFSQFPDCVRDLATLGWVLASPTSLWLFRLRFFSRIATDYYYFIIFFDGRGRFDGLHRAVESSIWLQGVSRQALRSWPSAVLLQGRAYFGDSLFLAILLQKIDGRQ